jgi:hypothetical protein
MAPIVQSAWVAQVGRAPAGHAAMHWVTLVMLGVFALGR